MKDTDPIETLYPRPTSADDYIHAAHMMEAQGGGFAACIARAYYKADLSNRARLQAAFPDLFNEFYTKHIRRMNDE
jgi:hypothetical protein